MKQPTLMAIVLGLLIAMLPAALAFQPVNKLPAYGQAKTDTVIKGGKEQYQNSRADVVIKQSFYGTKWGGANLRKAINRTPGGYSAKLQSSLGRQGGAPSVATLQSVSGQVGMNKKVATFPRQREAGQSIR